jgi:peptidoglycan/LPS O-acetylase OafA/YrhL
MTAVIINDTKKPQLSKPQSRLSDVDALRGLLIILVVYGHITLHSYPQGNEWYEFTRTVVYLFHMPAFLFVSGFIYFYTGNALFNRSKYFRSISSRAERLLIPYFAMIFVVIFGKMIVFHFLPVDAAPKSLIDGILGVFGPASESPVNSLWYLFVLFIYCVVTPLLMMLLRGKIELVFILAIVLYFNKFTEYFYIHKSSFFYVFFIYGCIACKYSQYYLTFIDRYRILLGTTAVSIIAVVLWLNNYMGIMVISFAAIPALHSICRLDYVKNSTVLQLFSKYSMIIYLLNSISSGVLKAFILKFSTWNGTAFLLWAPMLIMSGLMTPIACKVFLLDRVPYLRRLTS